MKKLLVLATVLLATPAFADDKEATGKLLEKTLRICTDAAAAAKAGGNAKDRVLDAWTRERGAWLALQDGKLKEAAKLSLVARTNCFMVLTQNGKGQGMDVGADEHALAKGNDDAVKAGYEQKGGVGRPTEQGAIDKFDPHRGDAAAAPKGPELAADLKVLLDKECAKTAKAKADAPCQGVGQATLFDVMMGSDKFRAQLQDPKLSEAVVSYCKLACEAARK